MTANTGKIGLGTKFQMSNGESPETWSDIANVVSISGPSLSMEFVDKTHLRSTGGYREIAPHMKDGGEITLTCHFDPENATLDSLTGVRALFEDREKRQFRINYADSGGGVAGSGWDYVTIFEGYVIGLGQEISTDNMIEQDITVRVDGAVVLQHIPNLS